ncbi:oligosaccharide flippase family protein [Cumulibacter manganitolerans]|uniref:oligosaccharide flippase family protein n=1 Tax=Cumulibacter manganitolerans TaxID=1884992 RepID=UPI00129515EC|nr:oligosaccharide flippase family protein [Cumulibacter manganitolerans]
MMVQPAEDSVTRRASRAFGWSFGNTVAARLGTLTIGIALARVLGPEEFGIFAIATVTLLAILSFNELGVSLAIIRWRDDPATIAPTVNTVAALSSGLLTAAVMLAAPGIASLLGDPRATTVIRVLAVSILLDGLVATSAAVMQREFMQKQRTIADQVNTWLGAGLSLLLALLGWGAMSLAIGRLAGSLVHGALLVHWSPIGYRFGWDRDIARRLFRFGMPLAASSIVVFASGYVDQMIVGAVAGAQALGFYVLAFNLASWPVSIFSLPLRAVAPAAFSALKDEPERMTRNFTRVLTLLSCVALPACLAVSGAAGPVVHFVYGAAWAPAAHVLVWMAAFAALKIWFELAYDYVVVQGKPGFLLVVQISSFAVALPLMLWAVRQGGGPAVAAVQFLVGVVVVVPLYVLGLQRIGVRPGRVLCAVLLPVGAGLVAWLVGWQLARALTPAFVAASAAGLVAVLIIAALAWWQRNDLRLLRAAAAGRGIA